MGRLVGMVVAVVVGAAACAGMSVSTGERPPQAAVHPASPFDGDSNSRIAHGHGLRQVDGISVTLPKGWTFRRNPLPALLEPSVPFAVGSWRFPAGGNCALTHAINAEPTAAALVWLYEYTPAAVRSGFGDFPPRPKRFRLGPLQGPLECLGVRAYTVRFRSHHRYLEVQVVLGRHTPKRVRRAVVGILASIKVTPRPG